jgi:hypothetical protein
MTPCHRDLEFAQLTALSWVMNFDNYRVRWTDHTEVRDRNSGRAVRIQRGKDWAHQGFDHINFVKVNA